MTIRAAILTGLVVGLASVAYAHGDDKDRASDEQASKSAPAKGDPDPKSAKPLTAPETQVLSSLHAANQTEVAAGKLAEKNSMTPAIQRYGRMLVKDHGAADRKLSAFAKKRAVALTGVPRDLGSLEKKQGAEFDDAFLTMMIKDHGEAIALVERAQQQCDDREVRAILEQVLPTLKKHQSQAVKMQLQQQQAQLN
jgi:putative membrane protein